MPSKIPRQLQLVDRHSNVFHPRRRLRWLEGWPQQEIPLFHIKSTAAAAKCVSVLVPLAEPDFVQGVRRQRMRVSVQFYFYVSAAQHYAKVYVFVPAQFHHVCWRLGILSLVFL
jgi:hypothetical protein